MSIRLHVDTSAVEAGLKALGEDAPKAVARALDRTARTIMTLGVKKVSAEMGLAQKFIRGVKGKNGEKGIAGRVFIVKSGKGHVTHINASTQPVPVMLFNARGPEPSKGRGRGVSARTKTRRYPHAFLSTMQSGHRGVFEYIGNPSRRRRSPGAWRDNLRIRELREASVAAVWIHHQDEMQKRGEEVLPKNLAHEVQFLLTTKVQSAFNRGVGARRVSA